MTANEIVTLDAETAKHIWQVLRMDAGDKIMLTDGKGTLAEGTIHTAERHKCHVVVGHVGFHPRRGNAMHLCVGFTKNNSRNEWMLEKATELGVASIVPLAAYRSEKTHVRQERWNKILQSAILQSQQNYLPDLYEALPLFKVLAQFGHVPQKFVAHCIDEIGKTSLHKMLNQGQDCVMLIGPEGDFSKEEVNLCIEHGFKSVSLGTQRLRTETAAIAAAAYFNVISDENA